MWSALGLESSSASHHCLNGCHSHRQPSVLRSHFYKATSTTPLQDFWKSCILCPTGGGTGGEGRELEGKKRDAWWANCHITRSGESKGWKIICFGSRASWVLRTHYVVSAFDPHLTYLKCADTQTTQQQKELMAGAWEVKGVQRRHHFHGPYGNSVVCTANALDSADPSDHVCVCWMASSVQRGVALTLSIWVSILKRGFQKPSHAARQTLGTLIC